MPVSMPSGKEYRYFVYRGKVRDPFRRHYAYHFPYPLDVDAIREGASFLKGKHDFTSFCSAKTEVEDRVRELTEIEITEDGDLLMFRFAGTGFLYNMVRIMVGTLLDVGAGEIKTGSDPRNPRPKRPHLRRKNGPAPRLVLVASLLRGKRGQMTASGCFFNKSDQAGGKNL